MDRGDSMKITPEEIEKLIEQFKSTPFIFLSHKCKCGCTAEMTDTSTFSYPEGLHVRIYPCSWHVQHWNSHPRKRFHIEKWGYDKSEKYGIELVWTWDLDLSDLYFTRKTPPYMVRKLNRQWYEVVMSDIEEDE